MRVRSQRRYEPSFRAGAVALLEKTDRTLFGVAKDLGVPIATLRYWYDSEMEKKRKKKAAGAVSSGDGSFSDAGSETLKERLARVEKENAQLRKKNAQLEEDRVILKKAAAFFAKESE